MTDGPNPAPPLVSAIIIFLDEARYLAEAIAGVRRQTLDSWELILVDDGSTDGSTDIAKTAAASDPRRIRYLAHPDGENLGMSASRNLGIAHARGRYVAFCDGDDVWLPDKLRHQTDLAVRHEEAAMIVAPLLRWHRWTGAPDAADLEDLMGVGKRKFGCHPHAQQVVEPPTIVRLMLRDDYFIPGGALIRRDVLTAVGGYHDEFRSMYEDAVVMMKIAARYPVYVDSEVHYLYRIHPESSTNTESSSEEIDRKRAIYLDATEHHLRNNGLLSPTLERALTRARRSTHHRRRRSTRVLNRARVIGRIVLPRPVRDILRISWRNLTRPEVAGER